MATPCPPEIAAIIAQIPGWRPDELTLAPLPGGLTNRNFRLERGPDAFVLRLGGDSTRWLGIDRSYEQAATVIAAHLGIGPEVIFADAAQQVLVTRLVPGRTLSPAEAAGPALLPRLVAAIRTCHDGPAFPGAFSPFETVRRYHQLALEQGVVFPPEAAQALGWMDRIEAALGPPEKLQPCHNDLLAANFIDDGERIHLIDWEYAGMGDIFFDLGNFAVNQALDETASDQLLTLYFGQARPAGRSRLELMKLASDLREAWWGFLQSGVSALDFDYRDYARRHLERFLATAGSPHCRQMM